MSEIETPLVDLSSVTDHRRALTNMLHDLKTLSSFARQLELSEVVKQADQTVERIQNSFFTVAVVGEFKRGKSTLINALLGREVLPADVLPCSATLNRVTYGLTPSVTLVFKAKDDKPEHSETIGVDDLVHYVTKLTPESETRAADIHEAIVYYPTPYCRDSADIVDTPGLNDDENMTSVTLSVLPKADAAIMMVLAQSPFGGYEGQFLNERMLMSDIGRVLFVVNRIDQIDEEDRLRLLIDIENRILESVERRAAEVYGKDTEDFHAYIARVGKPKVFGVSAKQALRGKLRSDNTVLEQSGFPQFERALEHFLTYERGAVTMQVLADTCVSSAAKILHTLGLQENALNMKAEQFEELYHTTTIKLDELRARYQTETHKISQASQRTLAIARKHLAQLEAEIPQAVSRAVDSTEIKPEDVDKKKDDLVKELGNNVSSNVRQAVQVISERIQLEIERELNREIGRLNEFAGELNSTLNGITLEFHQLKTGTVQDGATEGALAVLPIIGGIFIGNWAFGLGGIWAGYREAGLKGAVVGGVAGVASAGGALMGTVLVASILALPISLPVLLVSGALMGVASVFGGRSAVRAIFAGERAEKFKENYRKTVLEKINAQIEGLKEEFETQVSQQIHDTFAALEQHVQVELCAPIEQTQKTLDDLRSQRTRSQTELELMLKDLAEIRAEVEKIEARAQAKSHELHQITVEKRSSVDEKAESL